MEPLFAYERLETSVLHEVWLHVPADILVDSFSASPDTCASELG